MRKLRTGLWVLLFAGCGGAPGEPYVGDVVVNWTGTPYATRFGVAVDAHNSHNVSTGKMRVIVGDGPVNCGATDVNAPTPEGVFVLFDVDPTVGSYNPVIDAVRT